MTLQPGADGWAGVVQALESKSSAAVWKCLFKSTFPSSSSWPLHWFGNAQQGGSTQLPSEASTVLGKAFVQGSHGPEPLCVPWGSCWISRSQKQQISFSPLGFTSSHLFHKIPVTKITELQYQITPCPGNNEKSPKSSSRMSEDFWLVDTILINSVPHTGRPLAKHPRHPRQDFPKGVVSIPQNSPCFPHCQSAPKITNIYIHNME